MLHFYGSFSSDIMAVKGLNFIQWVPMVVGCWRLLGGGGEVEGEGEEKEERKMGVGGGIVSKIDKGEVGLLLKGSAVSVQCNI